MPPPIFPRAIEKGDRLAIVAPASVPDAERIERAVEELHALGFRTKVYRDFYDRRGYLAGGDAVRAEELMRAFCDTEVQAILAARGGYGVTRILDLLDYDAIRQNPKMFVGFSDITALHLAIQKKTGLVTFHGPHPNDGLGIPDGWDQLSATSFWQACGVRGGLGFEEPRVGAERVLLPAELASRLTMLSPGAARGRLTGGNLAVVCSTIGTPYEIDTRERIVFLEDIGERPYRIDRCLSQLRLAGKLDQLVGVVLGWFTDCGAEGETASLTLREVFDDYLGGLGVPVILDFPAGHAAPNLTLPLGAMVEIDTDRARVAVVETEHPGR